MRWEKNDAFNKEYDLLITFPNDLFSEKMVFFYKKKQCIYHLFLFLDPFQKSRKTKRKLQTKSL